MTKPKANEPEVHAAAVPLPPQSIDFNALHDALAKGTSGDEALAGALNPFTSEKAMIPPPVEEVEGAVNAPPKVDEATDATATAQTSPDAS